MCTTFVHYKLETAAMHARVLKQAGELFLSKTEELENYFSGVENIVIALRESSILSRYLYGPSAENYHDAAALFSSVTNSNSDLLQVRFLDVHGKEKLRVDRVSGQKTPSHVVKEDLQEKGHRYYFVEASGTVPGSFWYSKLDQNVENKEIEIPHKPVLRVASPVYIDEQFQGIVIINLQIKDFLTRFKNNSLFDIGLIDREGFFLSGFNYQVSWSRYLESGYTLQSEYPDDGRELLSGAKTLGLQQFGELFGGSVSSILGKDNGILVLRVRDDAIQKMKTETNKAALLILAIIVIISIPLALLISRGPASLQRKIAYQNATLKEYLELIDKNIHTSTIDLNGSFMEVSTALAGTLGVSTEEMVGMQYESLYCSHLPKENYQKIWETVERGENWSGELQHQKKNGDYYWADTVIFPKVDEQQNLVCYSAIYQDITEKKHIEELSITDVMTGLYNRRFFDSVLAKELDRARRDNNTLFFAMLDLDYFKQYNDHYGHQMGDKVLTEVALVIKDKLKRASDYCFRLGGEEFGLLFYDFSVDGPQDFIESIREAIVQAGIEHKKSKVADIITVSIGLLSVKPGTGVTDDAIYRLADEALYQAKEGGRNMVVTNSLEPQN